MRLKDRKRKLKRKHSPRHVLVDVASFRVGAHQPLVLIAGPCVIESEKSVMKHAEFLKRLTDKLKIPFVFKSSYDKANRTSIRSYRGPGLHKGLTILKRVKREFGIPILTDIHGPEQAEPAAEVIDVLQIPALLCRQTDLLVAAAKTGRVINVKKGQFMAPEDMLNVVTKLKEAGNNKILLTDRGTSFGYRTLVSDFRSLLIMAKLGYPIIYDATHSVQQPGSKGDQTGGQSEYAPALARAAVAVGCDGLFMEVHERPHKALSDGPNMIPLNRLEALLRGLQELNTVSQRLVR